MPLFHDNAINAIRMMDAPHNGVAYRMGKGWYVYDVRQGLDAPDDVAEFWCYKKGVLPLPLSEGAVEVLASIIISLARELS